MTDDKEQRQPQLSHGLKSRHVELIALGGIIGTGLFLGAGQSINFAGPSIVLAYLIAGLAIFGIMRALGELLVSDPNCHSYIDLIARYLGPKVGFVAGWTYWICWVSIAMAEITASGLYMKFWFPNLPQWVTGLVILVLVLLLNSTEVSIFGETEFWLAIIKILAIVALIITGIVLVLIHFKTNVGHSSVGNLFQNGLFAHGLKGFFLSFQMVIFSFVGVEMIGVTAAETKDPIRELPKCVNSIPVRVILFYVGSLLALMCIYPWKYISASSSPFVQVFRNIGVGSAASIVNFVVLAAAASSCDSAVYSTGRMVYSMTYRSQSKWGKRLSSLSKHHVPTKATAFSTAVIALSVLLNFIIPKGIFSFISSVATTCFLFIWGLIIITHLKYRKLAKVHHFKLSFKMPGFPITDYLVLAFLAFVGIILLFKLETFLALIGSVVWLAGLYGFRKLWDHHHVKG